jgi:hypothetical protein
MPLTEQKIYKRAGKRQFYDDFCKYAKAPPFRRTVAASIDLALAAISSAYGFLRSGSYFFGLLVLVYLLIRDSGGRSIGKRLMGLVVVHYRTFVPCTLNQSIIRNCLYAAVCPALLIIGLASIGVAGVIFSFGFLLLALSRVSLLFFIGYDSDTGRTIPDSWAETHVLTPSEIATIFKIRSELDESASSSR